MGIVMIIGWDTKDGTIPTSVLEDAVRRGARYFEAFCFEEYYDIDYLVCSEEKYEGNLEEFLHGFLGVRLGVVGAWRKVKDGWKYDKEIT